MINEPTLADIAKRLEIIEERLNAVLDGARSTSVILTRAEAIEYVKKRSNSSFDRWVSKWGVRSSAHGRYSRAHLDLALAREGGYARVPASIRKRWLKV
ncbi:MAG TPA: hypothetical protein VKC60_07185 [Opitutaceae bacterium]|nr:hypothetical protein [Opitutaceae bacterium]